MLFKQSRTFERCSSHIMYTWTGHWIVIGYAVTCLWFVAFDWLIHLLNQLIDWFTYWLIDSLTDWFTYWLIHLLNQLIDWLTYWLIDSRTDGLINLLIDWFNDLLINICLKCCLVFWYFSLSYILDKKLIENLAQGWQFWNVSLVNFWYHQGYPHAWCITPKSLQRAGCEAWQTSKGFCFKLKKMH